MENWKKNCRKVPLAVENGSVHTTVTKRKMKKCWVEISLCYQFKISRSTFSFCTNCSTSAWKYIRYSYQQHGPVFLAPSTFYLISHKRDFFFLSFFPFSVLRASSIFPSPHSLSRHHHHYIAAFIFCIFTGAIRNKDT